MKIIIPGQTAIKKNSQRIVYAGGRVPICINELFKTFIKKLRIRPSAHYDIWEKGALVWITMVLRQEDVSPIVEYPVEMYYFFYRKDKRQFDLSNAMEGPQDVLQKAGIIENDSMKYVVPVIERRPEGYGWAVDKNNPRVEITFKPI